MVRSCACDELSRAKPFLFSLPLIRGVAEDGVYQPRQGESSWVSDGRELFVSVSLCRRGSGGRGNSVSGKLMSWC
jgi:hypothetical protein